MTDNIVRDADTKACAKCGSMYTTKVTQNCPICKSEDKLECQYYIGVG